MNSRTDPVIFNPLLDFSGLPRFPDITPEHIAPAVDALIASARETLETVATLTEAPRWDNIVQPLSDALDRLDRAWGQVAHLNAVVNTPALREAYKLNLPKLTAFHVDLAQDGRLFGRYRALADSASFASLDPAERRLDLQYLARLSPCGRRIVGRRQGSFQGDRRRALGAFFPLRRQHSRCDQRLRSLRRRCGEALRSSGRRARARERGGGRRRPSGLETHSARALLLPGDAARG